jgi:8-amino-7-oxononanoate synthase
VDRGVPQSLFQAVQAAKGRGSSVAICDARDPERVRKELASAPAGHRALLVSSIDPATGESTNLKVLEEICRSTGAILYLDDSHGLGVRGEHGGGACEEWGLEFENLILVSSLHNGLGSFGAFVAGRTEWIDLLRLTAKSYLHSSSVPPQVAESARVAIRLCLREEGRLRRERLTALSRRLASELDALGFTVRSREGGPLLVVQVSGEVKAILSSRFLFDRQIFVSAVLSPAIPRGEAALRIAITALHTDAEASQLLLAFADLMTYWRRYRSLLGPNLEFGREFVTRQVAAPLRRAIQDFSPHHGLIPRDQTT